MTVDIQSKKSLLTSLYQREDIFFPSLAKRGEGRFLKKYIFGPMTEKAACNFVLVC